MRILITGGNGYLGTKIVKELVKRGNTAVLSILEGTDVQMLSNMPNVEIYGTTTDEIEKACTSNIDCVLHLATLYGRKNEEPNKILQANLMYPMEILYNSIKNNVKYFFNMDTAINEFTNEYSMSKKQFRNWGKYYAENNKIRFINMVSEHFYGPHDNTVKFIANMLKQLKENTPYIETTLGEQERAFIYIDDLIEAILKIIDYESSKNLNEFVEYEIGPEQNTKIKDALLIMKKLTASKSEIKFGAIPYRKNEEMKSSCDNSKLKSIGWKQNTLTFEEGIKKILKEEKNENIN